MLEFAHCFYYLTSIGSSGILCNYFEQLHWLCERHGKTDDIFMESTVILKTLHTRQFVHVQKNVDSLE